MQKREKTAIYSYFVIGILLLLFLTGCDTKEIEAGFNEAATGSIGFQLNCDNDLCGQQTIVKVKDKRITGVLLQYFNQGKKVNLPEEKIWDGYTISFNFPGRKETSQYKYLVERSCSDASAYIEFPEGWYCVPGKFNSLLKSLEEYHSASGEVDPSDEEFLKKYDWTVFYRINEYTVKLPKEFKHLPGEYPVVFYWAHNNELNKDIGLDILPYQGKDVTVRIYKTVEPLPDYMSPLQEGSRAVVVLYQGKIIGSWMDAGRHNAFACSLKKRTFEEVTSQKWEKWLVRLIDTDNPLERKLSKFSPQEIVKTYFESINSGDLAMARACESRSNLTGELFSNMNNNYLYNNSFEVNERYSIVGNMRSVRIIKMEGPYKIESMPDSIRFTVVFDVKEKTPSAFGDGEAFRFCDLKQETPVTGWRIESLCSGP